MRGFPRYLCWNEREYILKASLIRLAVAVVILFGFAGCHIPGLWKAIQHVQAYIHFHGHPIDFVPSTLLLFVGQSVSLEILNIGYGGFNENLQKSSETANSLMTHPDEHRVEELYPSPRRITKF